MDREPALTRVRDELARGEYLLAYDAAREAAAARPDDLRARYYAVLALARAGASERAAEELAASGLDAELGVDGPGSLAEDVAALDARLAKDRAVRATGDARRRLAPAAAERYESVYRRFGDPYPCINAATMWLLSGDEARAAALANEARRLVTTAPTTGPDDAYWLAATEAEAALVLGDAAATVAALRRAAAASTGDLAARASTRRQLGLICDHRDVDRRVLDALPVPSLVHYCGHRVSADGRGRMPAGAAERVAGEISAYLEGRDVGFAYGSLASGADLLVAEAVLGRGSELHVFLPFGVDEFVTTSVADAGIGWVARFERSLEQATSVTILGDGPYLGDDVLFEYCARVAMGRALIRSEFLTAAVEQLAVWDGHESGAALGTAADVATWRRAGGSTHVIASQPTGDPPIYVPASRQQRVVRAMLFGDVQGFSRLDDPRMVAFGSAALGAIAETLSPYEEHILNRRTWGDGLHFVFTDVVAAANCALDLQDTMRSFDWSAAGFDRPLRLRVGAHVGPVIEIFDAVRQASDFTGTHVVRTARVEPGTPPGDVYVTDPFAALLALEDEPSLSCQYVGHIPSAKDYGTFPMYVLRRNPD